MLGQHASFQAAAQEDGQLVRYDSVADFGDCVLRFLLVFFVVAAHARISSALGTLLDIKPSAQTRILQRSPSCRVRSSHRSGSARSYLQTHCAEFHRHQLLD